MAPELAKDDEDEGPNGEPLLIGGSGKESGFWYQYYVSNSGEEIKHGKFHGSMSWSDSNGQGVIEADYKNGVLVRRVGWDGAGRVVDTIVRQADGTYLWDEIRPIWQDVRVRYRSVAEMKSESKLSTTKDLKAVILTAETVHDRSNQNAHGFVNGLELAMRNEPEMRAAVQKNDTKTLNRILLQIMMDVDHYRRKAIEQRKVGGNDEYLSGIADGLVYFCEHIPLDAQADAENIGDTNTSNFPTFTLAKGVWKCRKTGLNFYFEPLIVTGPNGEKGVPKSILVNHSTAPYTVTKAGEVWTFDFHENGIVYASPQKNVENKRSRIGQFSFDGEKLDIKLALTASRADLGKIPWEYEFELVRP
ncbi:MAG: hypothetical protein R3C18_21445 [Planctomycetaceae bacterium]